MNETPRTPAGSAFTGLIIETFRLNGELLAAGDELCADLGLTSARWQVMGAIGEGPLPVAHIARNMGLTRQAVQRVADELAREGFIAFADNPHHRRAKLAGLTAKGRASLDEVNQRQAAWANRIAAGLDPAAIEAAASLAETLRRRLVPDTRDRLDSGGRRPPHSVSLPPSSPWRAGISAWPHPQADAAGRENPRILAVDSTGVPSPLGEKDRMRGDFAKQLRGSNITPPDFGSKE